MISESYEHKNGSNLHNLEKNHKINHLNYLDQILR